MPVDLMPAQEMEETNGTESCREDLTSPIDCPNDYPIPKSWYQMLWSRHGLVGVKETDNSV